jgi:hypothetical protein
VITITYGKSFSVSTTYAPGGGRIASVRVITGTDAQGNPQLLTGIVEVNPTEDDSGQSGVIATLTNKESSSQSSTPTTTSSDTTSANLSASPSSSLSTWAVAGLSVSTILAVVALAVGAYPFWRRRRTKRAITSVDISEAKAHRDNVHTKAELPASDGLALHEMDRRSTVPQEDRLAKTTDGELKDGHAL